MASDAHRQATSFVRALLDFKGAVERGEKSAANVHHIYACGLISGATLSGGMSKTLGLRLMSQLEDSRSALMVAFGEMPPIM